MVIVIYEYIIHRIIGYHCILFEEKELKFVLPFEAKIEELLKDR